MNIDKIEQEANWFMGDKDNQQHLAEYVPDLLAEVKRLRGLLKANECMETCHVGVPCPHGKSCDHIGAGRLTPQELEYEYEYYLRWYCRLREHIGETKWIDLYQEMCKGDDE